METNWYALRNCARKISQPQAGECNALPPRIHRQRKQNRMRKRMKFIASIANTLWAASNFALYKQFRSSLREPQVAQRQRLHCLLRSNAQTAFGKMHRFDRIRSYEEFAQSVPLSTCEDFAPWIDRIRRGEQQVLTSDRVTH